MCITATFHDCFQHGHVTGESVRPLSCYCRDHSQLSQAMSFIKWGSLLSHIMRRLFNNVMKKYTSCFFKVILYFHYSHFIVSSLNQRGALYWTQILMFLMVVSAPVKMHTENLLDMLISKAYLRRFLYKIHTVYDWNTNYLQYPATNIMLLQLGWNRVNSSKQCAVWPKHVVVTI
jgi:hypothetical protein